MPQTKLFSQVLEHDNAIRVARALTRLSVKTSSSEEADDVATTCTYFAWARCCQWDPCSDAQHKRNRRRLQSNLPPPSPKPPRRKVPGGPLVALSMVSAARRFQLGSSQSRHVLSKPSFPPPLLPSSYLTTQGFRKTRSPRAVQPLQRRQFHATPTGRAAMLTGPVIAYFFHSTRTLLTALPMLWRWQWFAKQPKLMWSLASLPILGVAALIGLAYEEHPFTDRSRFMFIDEPTELQWAADSYPALMSQHRDHLLPASHPDHKLLGDIASELLRIVGPIRQWNLHVIDDDSVVNAFVTPKGDIFVYTGLLRTAEDEDAVAAILAHELAHVLSRHGAEKMGFQYLARLGWDFVHSLIYTLTVNLPMIGDLAGRGLDVSKDMLTSLPYSRMCEKEADTIGMYLMSVAGFDPQAAVLFWSNMSEQRPGSTKCAEFLSDHPSHKNRADDLKVHLPGAQEVYRSRLEIANKVRDARLHLVSNALSERTMDEHNRSLFTALREALGAHHPALRERKLARELAQANCRGVAGLV
ncbi:hypothetical protein HKX48_005613 [Thoreauomyces humboldtii]|nr:hypothetical protein HKX48_005613 [Thoreauomyces humboldtii]